MWRILWTQNFHNYWPICITVTMNSQVYRSNITAMLYTGRVYRVMDQDKATILNVKLGFVDECCNCCNSDNYAIYTLRSVDGQMKPARANLIIDSTNCCSYSPRVCKMWSFSSSYRKTSVIGSKWLAFMHPCLPQILHEMRIARMPSSTMSSIATKSSMSLKEIVPCHIIFFIFIHVFSVVIA